MARLILNGKEQAALTVIKDDVTEIAVEIISNIGEYIEFTSKDISFFEEDDRSTTPVLTLSITGSTMTLTSEVSGAGTNLLDYADYTVYGTANTSGGQQTGINPSTITIK